MKLRSRLVFALAFALSLAPSLAHAQMPTAPTLVIDTRLGAGVGVAGGSSVIIVPSLSVGVRLIDRLQISLGIGLFRTAAPAGVDAAGNAVGSNSQTSFTVIPSVTLDIFKSRDNKAALYGKVALPIWRADQQHARQRLEPVRARLRLRARRALLAAPKLRVRRRGRLERPVHRSGRNPRQRESTSFYFLIVGTFYFTKQQSY